MCFSSQPKALTTIPELVRPIHPWKDWIAFRKLTNWFHQKQPSIVHTHSGKAGILGRLAAAQAKVPTIIHTIHGPSFGPFQGPASNWMFRQAERRAGRVTTHFVTVADAMRDQYLAAGIGKMEQYTRIFSGFALEPFLSSTNDATIRARWGIAAESIVIGKIGRLFELKGHDDLFSIAPVLVARFPEIKFLLVGDGPWRARFEARAKELNLENSFIFTGLVLPSEIPGLVGIMDLLVHLSLREGLPRALPQALAAARPVIAHDCDGAREVCFNGKTGFLVRPNDHETLIRQILLLVSDEPLRRRLGQQGQDFVRERFGVERMVSDLYALYLQLTTDSRKLKK